MSAPAFQHQPIDKLIVYVMKNSEIQFGKTGANFVNVQIFNVRTLPSANAVVLKQLVQDAFGDNGGADLFDGDEHSGIAIGGWMQHPQYNLSLMGMGHQLGLWKLNSPLSPFDVINVPLDPEKADGPYANMGVLAIKA
jgi:hypothetical protein